MSPSPRDSHSSLFVVIFNLFFLYHLDFVELFNGWVMRVDIAQNISPIQFIGYTDKEVIIISTPGVRVNLIGKWETVGHYRIELTTRLTSK